MTANYPAAVLWDMDGTLVETESYWITAQSGILERHDLPPLTPAQDLELVGSSLTTAAEMFQQLGVPLSIAEIIDTVSNEVIEHIGNGLTVRPGARELLAELRAHDVPTAIVTNSGRAIVDAVLPHLAEHEFSHIVTSEDVVYGKPDPGGYLLAAERLGVRSEDCVVIEDSVNGLGGAIAARTVPIGVPYEMHLEPTKQYIRVESLTELDWPVVSRMYAEFRREKAASVRRRV